MKSSNIKVEYLSHQPSFVFRAIARNFSEPNLKAIISDYSTFAHLGDF